MQECLDKKYEKEFTFDLPIEIHGLALKPVAMYDYMDFMVSISMLKMNKNEIDVSFISMTYLDFVISMCETMIYKLMLYKCFSLATGDPNVEIMFGKDKTNKPYIQIGETVLNSEKFDDVRSLILFQNLPNYEDDSHMDIDLKKALEEYDRLINKGKKWASLEKQVVAVQLGTHMSLKQIYEMSIRKFIISLEMIDKKLHYTIYKSASYHPYVEFKKGIEHYLEDNENGISNKIVDADAFKNKINSVNN